MNFLSRMTTGGFSMTYSKKRIGRAAKALTKRWNQYVIFDYPNPSPDPKLLKEMHEYFLSELSLFATSEDVEYLKEFVEKHRDYLGEFSSKLEEVRRREPVKVEEPAFRCERKPPLEGMKKPPEDFFAPRKPKPAASPPSEPQVIIVEP